MASLCEFCSDVGHIATIAHAGPSVCPHVYNEESRRNVHVLQGHLVSVITRGPYQQAGLNEGWVGIDNHLAHRARSLVSDTTKL